MAAKKWFHAIGASGKATSNVAKLFKDMGWFVTGSDIQFLPPASDVITENKIPFDEGYTFKHLDKQFWEDKLGKKLNISEHPELCLIVESATHKNKEYLYAKRLGLDVRPYSKILGEYLVKKNSVVVIGTAGKTTTTTLIAKILEDLGVQPSFMIGADVFEFKDSLRKVNSDWSVLEGDEYHSRTLSDGAKFLEYKPKYLLITNVGYEHQDVFPTQNEYIKEFQKAVELVPKEGLIVAKSDDKNIDKVLKNAKCKVIRYQSSESKSKDIFTIKSTSRVDAITEFEINKGNSTILKGSTALLGEYNLENIVGAVALVLNLPAHSLPIEMVKQGSENMQTIRNTIGTFVGPKKRLELLFKGTNRIVVDDFGVAPERAKNSLKTLKENFEEYKIIAIFEPNSGSRPGDEARFKKMYKNVFNDVNELIIPELSDFNSELASSEQMVDWLQSEVKNIIALKPDELSNHISGFNKNEKYLIVFFSSYRLTQIAHGLAEKLSS